MGRRREHEEIAFGSDSFLDILANIVGILIILIVIAGVRVSQTPVTGIDPPQSVTAHTDAAPQLAAPQLAAHGPADDPSSNLRQSQTFPTQPAEEPEPIEQPPIPEPPPLSEKLVADVEGTRTILDRLSEHRRALAADEQVLLTEHDEVQRQLAEAGQDTETLRRTLAATRETVSAQEATLQAEQQALASLQVALAEVESQQPPATVLKHKLTPVGRETEGNEVHFLLSQGRVAVVPMEELAEQLKAQLERKAETVARTNRYIGSIGPVQGFQMDYVFERRLSTLIEDLRMGRAAIRVGLSEYRITPQSSVKWESKDQALHPRGRFLSAVRRAGPSATLTYWVYPESFALHRELLEFAHEHGYEVASRPLPEGVPIMGSPKGSRSVVQ